MTNRTNARTSITASAINAVQPVAGCHLAMVSIITRVDLARFKYGTRRIAANAN